MSLFKKSLELISELAKTECGDDCNTINNKSAEIEFDTVLGDMPIVPNNQFKYVPEAVNIQVTKLGYVVEMDDLAKYMLGAKVHGFAEALDQIATGNGVEPGSIKVCIDEDAVKAAKDDAVKGKGTGKCKKCGNPVDHCTCGKCEESFEFEETLNVINACKEQGIEIVKRSSKVNY